jgi:hypothetical protein
MDNFLSLTGRPPLGGDGGLVLVRLMDALGNLVTFLHGVIDRLKAMRGSAEAASPSRTENPAPMGFDAGLSPIRLLEGKHPDHKFAFTVGARPTDINVEAVSRPCRW